MTVPVITWDPPIPQRPTDSRAEFNANATTFVASLPTLKFQINDANQWANTQYEAIDTLSSSRIEQIETLGDSYIAEFNATKETIEELSLSAQEAAEVASGAANYKDEWANLSGSLVKPASVSHNGRLWLLINDLSSVELSEPSPQNSDWMQITQLSNRAVVATPATISNSGMYFVIGSGDVTISPQSQVGATFDFVASIGSSPKIYGNITTELFGDVDYVELDNQLIYQFIYNNLTQRLEV